MNYPKTPTKKGEEINRLVQSLNNKWGLRLPDKTIPFSPSKVANPDGTGEKIYGLIRFLYFQRHEDLQRACEQFEKHARQQAVQWVHKPQADTDTLPSRKLSDSVLRRGSYPRVNGVDGVSEAVVSLEEVLLRFLAEARDAQPSPTHSFSATRNGLSCPLMCS